MSARRPTAKASGRSEQLVLPTPAPPPPKEKPKRGGRPRAPEEAANHYIRRRAKPSVVPGSFGISITSSQGERQVRIRRTTSMVYVLQRGHSNSRGGNRCFRSGLARSSG